MENVQKTANDVPGRRIDDLGEARAMLVEARLLLAEARGRLLEARLALLEPSRRAPGFPL